MSHKNINITVIQKTYNNNEYNMYKTAKSLELVKV